ncbi:sigma 54-interacting transcriptional regulator [Aquibacillus rhizosphaerae]|uniref:Sigma 54-interacting transcriptional regulator n=1 Tax=Aquibacillus rhizosphaerae TaxID=3051431 RepID=A0ABT7L6Y2_9BACI|nr:sigma 54-interacting transcriptional regulator [Aquibacillus sp. LR5S19]MDL4841608.1 sigma 54-interacting transcriptional regulator [Aquibacillus sp. LR5S19]
MKRVLIIGAGNGGTALLKLMQASKRMNIVAIIDIDLSAPGLKIAKDYHVTVGEKWLDWIYNDIDIAIDATGTNEVYEQIMAVKTEDTIVLTGSIAYLTVELLEEKEQLLHKLKLQTVKQDLILNNIHEGMIVVDDNEKVTFVNKRAEEIVGVAKRDFISQPVRKIIDQTRLPEILRTRQKEVNKKLKLENGKQIISTRIPIIDTDHNLKGAFSIFRDITEVAELAEKVTGLKEVKKMLEAIFHSSEEAISVVDEQGYGIMVNPAYTRITGMGEKDIVGKHASVDIVEGESMHIKVLQTRRAVRGVRMKVGPLNKDVIVNVAPIIVDGKLKGSVGILHDMSEIQSLTSELRRARKIIRNLEAKYTFDDIIGLSSEMILAIEQAKVGAKTPAIVLLRGESGTGKELFAHAIHNQSNRRHNKFIRVNCAATSETMLECQLFGYEDGAFSGAKLGGETGYFEEANYGSVFLDEIGGLSLSMQAKLLRVIEESEIVRVGSTKPIPIDVRIITATNVNLEKAIMNGKFKKDLYYRLNRLPIYVPSLRERMDDLEELINDFIHKINQAYGRNVKTVEDRALDYLRAYDWPGNIRELENVISRAMINMDMDEDIIQFNHVPALKVSEGYYNQEVKSGDYLNFKNRTLQQSLDAHEKQVIEMSLKIHNYNKTKTAQALGISIRSLYYKANKYGISRESMKNNI